MKPNDAGKKKKEKGNKPAAALDRAAGGKEGGGEDRGDGTNRRGGRRIPVVQNPSRGAPGILMTCERGKEVKCQREGLEIIQHYYSKLVQDKHENNDAGQEEGAKPTLSLDEELKQLQSGNNNGPKSYFSIFQTGCRGTVFALCTVPGSEMIPSVKEQKLRHHENNAGEESSKAAAANDTEEPVSKKQKIDSCEGGGVGDVSFEEESASTSKANAADASYHNPKWDPVPIVRHILEDIENDSARDAPGSRFVTRMVPIQATCFASQEELQITSRSLIQRYFPPSATTFAIVEKRRMCPDKFTKQMIIDTVYTEVLALFPKIKVHLDNPDVTVIVEICKTLCGVSVIPNCKTTFRNFNLAVARDEQNKDDEL